MKDIRRGNCPLCDHPEIVEAVSAEFINDGRERIAAVTYDPRWMLEGRNPSYPHGALKRYVCRSCGFAQEFASNPGAIPIGDQHRTRVISGVKASEPYR